MVEVVVSEEQVVDFCGPKTSLHHFGGGGGAAVDHYLLTAGLDHERRSESGGCRRRRSGSNYVHFCHDEMIPLCFDGQVVFRILCL